MRDDTVSMNGTIQKRPGPRSPMYRPSRSTTARSHCRATRGACISVTPTMTITTSGTRFPEDAVPTTPAGTDPRRIAIATTLTFDPGDEDVYSCRLRAPGSITCLLFGVREAPR